MARSISNVVAGNFAGRNFGDDLMLAGWLARRSTAAVILAQKVPLVSYSWLDGCARIVQWRLFRSIVLIARSRAFLMCGGTHLNYSSKEPRVAQFRVQLIWLIYGLVCRIFRTDFVLKAVGVGPFDSRFARIIARFTLACAKEVHVRDRSSLAICKSLGAKPIYREDLAFSYLRLVFAERHSETCPAYLLVAPAASTFDLSYWTRRVFETLSQREVDHVIIFAAETDGRRRDSTVCELLATEITRKHTVNVQCVAYKGDLEKVLGLICAADSVLAARYHVVLVAKSLGVPLYPVSYHDKVSQLLREFST